MTAARNLAVDFAELRRELAADIGRAGYVRGDFVFAGGEEGETYFDKYGVLSRSGMLLRAARLMAPSVPEDADRLASTSPSTTALATAVALECGLDLLLPHERDADEPYRFGGETFPGVRVCLLEDVFFTGTRALAAAESLRSGGAEVVRIIALLDREQGALHRLESAGYPAGALYTEAELR
jgi:orotate phosphoribosyltransferase